VGELAAAFHTAHAKAFGYSYEGQQRIELVNFAVSGFGLIDRPKLPTLPVDGAGRAQARSARRVFFDGAWRDTPIFDRAELGAGARIDGPAVVEEFGSTTVVFPQQYLTVDPHGILIVRSTRRPKDAVPLEVVR
jgi:N-methylhydantoinase A